MSLLFDPRKDALQNKQLLVEPSRMAVASMAFLE
jgi:hypothetical protein